MNVPEKSTGENIRYSYEATECEQGRTVDGKIVYNSGKADILKWGITEIKKEAYEGNKDIVSVVLPSSVTSIGEWAFYGCSSLTSITMPSSVTSIDSYAFYGCNSLTSITIPSSVTSIDWSAFRGCSSLKITVSPENKHYKVIDNNLYTYDGKTIVKYMPKKNETSFAIPSSVTSIGWGAFGECSDLTSITIPNSVTRIEFDAFYDCKKLTSITIPSSVTSIGDCVFSCCNNLKDIYFDGKKAEWDKIKIGSVNQEIKDAKIHFKTLFGYTK